MTFKSGPKTIIGKWKQEKYGSSFFKRKTWKETKYFLGSTDNKS